MTSPRLTTPRTDGPRTWRPIARHYLEMVAAMLVGMLVLGTPRAMLGADVSFEERPALGYLLMATDMSIAMAALMRWRGHTWSRTLEMCAVMYVPLVLVPLVRAGAMSAMDFMMVAHVAMLVLMLGVVLLRRAEYAHDH
ncbi:hypothetical protein PZ938_14305 [Luteipulveratus sp. YIM 133132]|uniref:hypothetical protein n=1 Tax=Luteipulveratus flavus TaxID=3031728 RepID=UPI0023B03DCA|nr:hypothetical protein [Luteipulveratus sp. YIM 133132]MDE9366783.1 hypothetical protein [Luteipulveratus sp. YIM 133132]